METTPLRAQILDTIIRKSTLKQRVFDNTFGAFNSLKETLLEMASEMDDGLDGKLDRRVRLEYRDRGKFEAQLQVANDILIFQMHTDVFEFGSDHLIWQNPYVQADRDNSYCGLINIYNFLSDSFKFNRNADEGYLIGRIFINRERRYFAEGKQQNSMRAMDFRAPSFLASIAATTLSFSSWLTAMNRSHLRTEASRSTAKASSRPRR